MSTPKCVNDYFELRNVPSPPSPCEYIFVAGLPDPQNSGIQGFFEWQPHSRAEDNYGTVIKPTSVNSKNPGRWHRVFDGAISVKWFGARGHDKNSDSEAIFLAQKALVAYGGGYLDFPAGTYLISQPLNLGSNITLRGAGPGVSTIVAAFASDMPPGDVPRNPAINPWMISFQGALDPNGPVLLAGDIAQGDTAIQLPSGHGLVAGDHIILTSDDTWHGIPDYSGNSPKGERAVIVSATPTSATLQNTVDDFYTVVKCAKVWRINRVSNVGIENLTIKRAVNAKNLNLGIHLEYCDNATISNVQTFFATYTALSVDSCLDVFINNSHLEECWCIDPVGQGANYGIAISNASQDIRVVGCYVRKARSCFNAGKNSAAGIPRRVAVVGCTFDNTEVDTISGCVETHWVSERFTFTGCTAKSAKPTGGACAFGLDGYYHQIIGCVAEAGGINVGGGLDTQCTAILFSAINAMKSNLIAHFNSGLGIHLSADSVSAMALASVPDIIPNKSQNGLLEDQAAANLINAIATHFSAHEGNGSAAQIHINPTGDDVDLVLTPVADGTSQQTIIDLFIDLFAQINAHFAGTTWHTAADTSNQLTVGLVDYRTNLIIANNSVRIAPGTSGIGIMSNMDGDTIQGNMIDMSKSSGAGIYLLSYYSTRAHRGARVIGNTVQDAASIGALIVGAQAALFLGNRFNNIGKHVPLGASGTAVLFKPNSYMPNTGTDCKDIMFDHNTIEDREIPSVTGRGVGILTSGPGKASVTIGPGNKYILATENGVGKIYAPDPTCFGDVRALGTVSSGQITLDLGASRIYSMTLQADTTFKATNLMPGPVTLIVTQDQINVTAVWPASFKFVSTDGMLSTLPPLPITDMFQGHCDGSNVWFYGVKKGF